MDNHADSYRRYLDGDDNGLVEIIGHYRYGLTLYIGGIVGDICLAEDIMQEVFVKLAVKKPKFDGKSSFKTWLYSVARNCAVDRLRQRARHKETPLDECFEVSDETDIEKQYIKEEQKIELHKAMKRLSPDHAQVLYLRYFEDFDTNEIAGIMRRSKRQMGNAYYTYDPIPVSADHAKLLMQLFEECRDIKCESDDDIMFSRQVFSVTADVEKAGIANRYIGFMEDGYMITNIMEYAFCFNIGTERVQRLAEAFKISEQTPHIQTFPEPPQTTAADDYYGEETSIGTTVMYTQDTTISMPAPQTIPE